MKFPPNLDQLHEHEETLRTEAVRRVGVLPNMALHFALAEATMDLLDLYRQQPSEDEDVKALQALGCRVFNGFASATTLVLVGYYQPSAMILRDILETVFLISYFGSEPDAIARWRKISAGKTIEEFKPVTVRKYLDKRDGFTEKKREANYKLFSQLAGHPTAASLVMLRPKGMDIRNGPFLNVSALEAVASEMGKLAVQAGGAFSRLLPDNTQPSKAQFARLQREWLEAMGFTSRR